ncbi:MAG: hypothetical protein ACJ77Y_04965 [Chloroflexota bacterium]
MPALEPVAGLHLVATPEALDAARWVGDDVDVIRIAPDEALALGATSVEIDAGDAIVEPEAGYSVALLDVSEVQLVAAHTDWPLPEEAGSLAQGKIAGVPAKLLVGSPTLLITPSAYADELARRLGWSR